MKTIAKNFIFLLCILFGYIISDRKSRILMYHSFLLPNEFFNVNKKDFIWQIRYLKRKGHRFVTMRELGDMIHTKKDLNKVIVLTFDDGYIDFLSIVLPILESENIPATLYWPTGVANNELFLSSEEKYPILDLDSVKTLSQNPLIEIGSHTVSHKELPQLSAMQIIDELKKSLETVVSVTNEEISFAYPRGKCNTDIAGAVKNLGYISAVTVQEGFVDLNSNIFELPRLSIDSSTTNLVFRAKMSPVYEFYLRIKLWIKK